jgi:hypothetical protein
MKDTVFTRRERAVTVAAFTLMVGAIFIAVLGGLLHAPYSSWEGITSTFMLALGLGMIIGMVVSNP